MILRLLTLCVLVTAPALAFAQATTRPHNVLEERRVDAGDPAAVADRMKNDAARKQMSEPLAMDLIVTGERLDAAVAELRRVTKLNIFMNWRALETIGLTKDVPFTVRLKRVTAGEALEACVKRMAGESQAVAYTVDDGIVTISTRDDLSRNTLTRVYDIRAALKGAGDEAGVNALIRRLQGLDPLSWRDLGGKVGTARELSGQLIVTHTPAMHQLIREELKDVLPRGAAEFPLNSGKRKE